MGDPQIQINQVIHSDAHLSSPIVRSKLALLWQLSGLPLPTELAFCVQSTGVTWEQVVRNESRTRYELQNCIRQLSSACRSRGIFIDQLTPLCHPKCITSLLKVQLSQSDSIIHSHQKLLRRIVQPVRGNIEALFKNISQHLIGEKFLFRPEAESDAKIRQGAVLSEGAQYLIGNSRAVLGGEYESALYAWYLIRQTHRYLQDKNKIQSSGGTAYILTGDYHIAAICGELSIIVDTRERKFTCLSFEMTLMYCDMVESRAMITLVSKLEPAWTKVGEKVNQLWELIDSLSNNIGGDIYPLVASLESLTYGGVQLFDRDYDSAGTFYAFVINEIEEHLKKHVDQINCGRIVRIIRNIYSGMNPDEYAEMLCTLRTWGHPLLGSVKAAEKVRNYMCAPKIVSFDIIQKVLAFFTAGIINGFRRTHSGLWPKVIPESIKIKSLEFLWRESSELTHQYVLRNYNAVSQIEFEKSIDYDLSEDLSTYLKDKAICRGKKEWASVYRRSLTNKILDSARGDSTKSNRLLLDFLSNSDFDPGKEFAYVTSMDYLRDDDFCASYSLKEKEVKVDGRIFAKMTRSMRNCQVMLEHLLAEHVCEFFKENGVVKEQISLTKSLLAMSQLSPRVAEYKGRIIRSSDLRRACQDPSSNPIQNGDTVTTRKSWRKDRVIIAGFLTTDLTKYCLNWRYPTIKLFAQKLNQLLGIPHGYEWHHLRLRDTTMFVGDPSEPPQDISSADLDDQPNEGIFIVSPRGGIEGLCQKMWSTISIAAIHTAAAETGCRVAAMVQGDNQTMAITKEVDAGEEIGAALQSLTGIENAFFEKFREITWGLGHNLKSQETIRSKSFFVYSKRIFFEGRVLSQGLKNASRLSMTADVLGENLVSNCGDIGSTIARIVENGGDRSSLYILNWLLVIKQIMFDMTFSIEQNRDSGFRSETMNSPDLIRLISLIPSQLGGLNFLNIARMFTRNIGDPVTTACSDVKWMIKSDLIPKYALRNIIFRKSGEGSWMTLCSDPYALNIPFTQLPTTYLKRHTQRVLLASSQNPMLKGTKIESQVEEEEELARFLLDRPQVMPRVAYAVFKSSVLGQRRHLQGLVDTTGTIIKHALKTFPISYKKCMAISNYTCDYIASFRDEIFSPNAKFMDPAASWDRGLVSEETCSVTLANYVRTHSWFNILRGRQIKGVTVPDTIEVVRGCMIAGGSPCIYCNGGDNSFTWFHLPAPISLTDPSESNAAQRVAYIGSKTEEKRAASLASVKNMTGHLKAALRGASVYMWAFGDTEKNWEDALAIARSRCNINLDQLKALCPIPSTSNIQHRLSDGISVNKFTPASLARVSSYIHICNDMHASYSNDIQIESNLIFQQVMLLGTGLLEALYPLTQKWVTSPRTLHLHSGMSCCIREADSGGFYESPCECPSITTSPCNPFLYDANPISDEDVTTVAVKSFKYFELGLETSSPWENIQTLTIVMSKIMVDTTIGDSAHTSIHNEAIITYDNSVNWISEFLYCDLRVLFEAAGRDLAIDLAYQLYYFRIRGVVAIVNYIGSVLDRIPGIQLANIALTISHPELFRRLQACGIVTNISAPYTATTNYHDLVKQCLLWGVKEYCKNVMNGCEPEYILPNDTDDLLSGKAEQVLARRMCLLTLIGSFEGNLPNIRELSPIEKCALLTSFCVASFNTFSTSKVKNMCLIEIIDKPKVTRYVTNLYFLSRKVLSILRESDISKSIVESLYSISEWGILDLDPVSIEGDDDYLIKSVGTTVINLEDADMSRHQTYLTIGESVSIRNQSIQDDRPAILRSLTKTIGTSSTSWYKGAALIATNLLRGLPSGKGLYLAEGSGSLMTAIEAHVCSEEIFYSSLFSSEMNPPQRNLGPQPVQFLNSTVHNNLRAGVPTKNGYVQEYFQLWCDDDDCTDLSTQASVNYIIKSIGVETSKIVVCDLEPQKGLDDSDLINLYTNVVVIASHCLRDTGRLILKIYKRDLIVFEYTVTLLWRSFFKVSLVISPYFNTGDGECYLVCQKNVKFSRELLMGSIAFCSDLVRNGEGMISDSLSQKIRKAILHCEESTCTFYEKIVSDPGLLTQTKTDIFLIQLGGQLSYKSLSWLAYEDISDANTLLRVSVDAVTIGLREIIDIRKQELHGDKLVLLSPYNIAAEGKVVTILQSLTRRLIGLYIRRKLAINPLDLGKVIQFSTQFKICINDMLSVRDFLRRTSSPKYFKREFHGQEIYTFFEEKSTIILTVHERKMILKFIGALVKGQD
nr:large polymerase [Avian paramyxovirus 14]